MDFDLFWQMYPRRVAKVAALKAWTKLKTADREAAIAALPAHVEDWSGRDMDKVPHPATWLNGRRFEDELQPRKPKQPELTDHEFFRIHGYSRQTADRWAMEGES
jgi:hypothetical protein